MNKPLRIAVDIRDLSIAKTGTLTYLEELCREFKKLESPELKFYFLKGLPVLQSKSKIAKLRNHIRFQAWKQILLPLKAFYNRCNIVFGTDNFVPLVHLGYKTVPVLHDAFYFENPEHYSKKWLWLFYKFGLPAVRRSAVVITPTQYAKDRIRYFTALPDKKFKVIYEGAKSLNFTTSATNDISLFSRYALSKGEYILHVGAVYKRKNIPALVYAFSELKQQGYKNLKLVLAGPIPNNIFGAKDYHELSEALRSSEFEEDIVLTGYIPDIDLAELYRHALIYAFPSVNEGFGIPVLEAFKFGVPVVAADNSCLPEVGGDAILTFNPFLAGDLTEKLRVLLNDLGLRRQLVSKGTERLKLFSWEKAAKELVAIFRSVA